MNRSRIRDLALVAVAGGLIAFEAVSLRGALSPAVQGLVGRAVSGEVTGGPRDAALATASVLRGVGTAATHATVELAKRAARRFGTVTPPVETDALVWVASHDRVAGAVGRVMVVTVSMERHREAAAAAAAVGRARAIARSLEAAHRRSTL